MFDDYPLIDMIDQTYHSLLVQKPGYKEQQSSEEWVDSQLSSAGAPPPDEGFMQLHNPRAATRAAAATSVTSAENFQRIQRMKTSAGLKDKDRVDFVRIMRDQVEEENQQQRKRIESKHKEAGQKQKEEFGDEIQSLDHQLDERMNRIKDTIDKMRREGVLAREATKAADEKVRFNKAVIVEELKGQTGKRKQEDLQIPEFKDQVVCKLELIK